MAPSTHQLVHALIFDHAAYAQFDADPRVARLFCAGCVGSPRYFSRLIHRKMMDGCFTNVQASRRVISFSGPTQFPAQIASAASHRRRKRVRRRGITLGAISLHARVDRGVTFLSGLTVQLLRVADSGQIQQHQRHKLLDSSICANAASQPSTRRCKRKVQTKVGCIDAL